MTGLLLQLIGFLLIGPSPLLNMKTPLGMTQLVGALVLFGAGESMSMTPVMDDMMHSCGDLAGASVNSLSSILAASFSLGQMVRPTSRWHGEEGWGDGKGRITVGRPIPTAPSPDPRVRPWPLPRCGEESFISRAGPVVTILPSLPPPSFRETGGGHLFISCAGPARSYS